MKNYKKTYNFLFKNGLKYKQSLEQYHCYSMVLSLVQQDIHSSLLTISTKYYLDLIHHASLEIKDEKCYN